MEMDLLEHYQQWHKEPNSAVPYLEKNQPLHEYVCQSANLLKMNKAQRSKTLCARCKPMILEISERNLKPIRGRECEDGSDS